MFHNIKILTGDITPYHIWSLDGIRNLADNIHLCALRK